MEKVKEELSFSFFPNRQFVESLAAGTKELHNHVDPTQILTLQKETNLTLPEEENAKWRSSPQIEVFDSSKSTLVASIKCLFNLFEQFAGAK